MKRQPLPVPTCGDCGRAHPHLARFGGGETFICPDCYHTWLLLVEQFTAVVEAQAIIDATGAELARLAREEAQR